MLIESGSPSTLASRSLSLTGVRLVFDRDELATVALGSNLPRTPEELPLSDVEYDEIAAMAELADNLTAVQQDLDLRFGDHKVAEGNAKEHFVIVPVRYKLQTLRMLGAWSSRYIRQLSAEGASDQQIGTAGWTCFELERLAEDSRVQRLTTLRILPADRTFWK
jgi:hypothetical protein